MRANTHRESAKIYAFPTGGRAGLATHREATRATLETQAPRVCYDSWYHEEAIKKEPTPKN